MSHREGDAGTFDDLVAHLDPPMLVVTTAAGGRRAGCLVGFHSQCSIDPPRYAVWLSKANHTWALARRADRVGVHVLGAGDLELAERFGTTCSAEVDKFAGLAVDAGPGDLPLLAGVPRFVGRVHAVLDDGSDHACVVTEPESVSLATRSGLVRLHSVLGLEPGHDARERVDPDG